MVDQEQEWKWGYTVVDLMQKLPTQWYNYKHTLDNGTTKKINALGVIKQYFNDHDIDGKPVKYWYCPGGNEYTGQNANTMGRFVVFIGWNKEDVDQMTIKEIKEYISTSRNRRAFSERDDFLMYNRTGYEFLIQQNKEKKISKKQEKQNNTYYIEDKTREFALCKVTASSKRHAINQYFKKHNIVEKPYQYMKLMNENWNSPIHYDGSARFYVYCEASPRLGTGYNRDGYITYPDLPGKKDIQKGEIREYEINEFLKMIDEKKDCPLNLSIDDMKKIKKAEGNQSNEIHTSYEGTYTVIDLLQKCPIKHYANKVEWDRDSITFTNARGVVTHDRKEYRRTNATGVIKQYFEDNKIVGKPEKSKYRTLTNYTGRFVVFAGYVSLDDEVTIEQIKAHIRFFPDGKAKYPCKRPEGLAYIPYDYLLYNRSGFIFLFDKNKEKKKYF